ncbi:peptidylprolyl isomerase [Phormidium tenue FACHB-886]|nr:peptidylprolyl isomerase [Phormidium tenue FACHB-886]
MTFLTIDNQPLSLEQSFGYLKTAGDLPKFILEIAQQYLLEKEIAACGIAEPDSTLVEKLMLEFRIKHQLGAAETFAQWLNSQGMTYRDFRRKITLSIQLNALKAKVTSDLESYFLAHKASLDRLVLSRIVVQTAELAAALKTQLNHPSADFSQLARQHSTAAESIVGGIMGATHRGKLPESIRTATDTAQIGQIVGPVEVEGQFWLVRVEQILPAVLEGEVKQELQNYLFKRWLTEKLKSTRIQMASQIN